MVDKAFVLDRISELARENEDARRDKWRIRAIMNGGVDGILAVMLWDQGERGRQYTRSEAIAMLGTDLPTVNLMHTGLERLAQMIGRLPTLKAPTAERDSTKARNQKRIEIVDDWDAHQRLELTMPQLGRWLPGYSFGMYSVTQGINDFGEWYPKVRLRDPYDVDPGYFGPDQQPHDAAVTRVVPLYALERTYPELDWGMLGDQIRKARPQSKGGVVDLRKANQGFAASDAQRTWEGRRTGVKVAEYYCDDGRYVMIPEIEVQLAYIANVLDEPPFVFGKRFSFDRLQSAYQQVIGLMAQLGKLNILGMVASEDSTFRETNIIGQLIGKEYQRGRKAVNQFTPGTVIDRPTGDQAQQLWAQIDRIERQIRIGANYDVQQDGTSPNSFATGQGMRELQTAAANNAREHQMVMEYMVKDCDRKRLQFAERMYRRQRRSYWDMLGERSTYRPSDDIKGDYRTDRIYGAMATFDDQLKIVVGLQLLQGDILDVETMQENIDGLRDLPLINQRIAKRKAKETLFERLRIRTETDPRADAALTRIVANPEDEEAILIEYFTPEVEEGGEGPPMAFPPTPPALGGGGAAPEQFATVLSRLEGNEANLGVQTVGGL